MTFSVPPALHKEMQAHREIKWSEVARAAIQKELERLHYLDRLLSPSKLTDADAVALGRAIRRRQ